MAAPEIGNLARGVLIGLSIAAPVGPIGVLCIRRTLAEGRAVGFCSGLGAATADALYGGIAGFGLTAVSGFLVGQQRWLRLVGGIFLLYLGLRTLLARPAERAAVARGKGLAGAYLSTLLLTLTNPTTILSFVAIFAGLGIASDVAGHQLRAVLLVVGVFSGSALWWLILSGGVNLLRTRLTSARLQLVNRAAGGVILAFGVVALASRWW